MTLGEMVKETLGDFIPEDRMDDAMRLADAMAPFKDINRDTELTPEQVQKFQPILFAMFVRMVTDNGYAKRLKDQCNELIQKN